MVFIRLVSEVVPTLKKGNLNHLNLWMRDMPFSLDRLIDLPRYVGKNTYQLYWTTSPVTITSFILRTVVHSLGCSGVAGFLLTICSRLDGKSLHMCTIQRLLASNYFRAMGILCLLHIDDLHQAAARSDISLVAYHLVKLGYFLGLEKSVLRPSKVVPCLGFLVNSSREEFLLKPDKKQKFLVFPRNFGQF